METSRAQAPATASDPRRRAAFRSGSSGTTSWTRRSPSRRTRRRSAAEGAASSASPSPPRWPRGSPTGSRRRRRPGRRRRARAWCRPRSGRSGRAPLAGPTKVPLAESRSSTNQRRPSVVSCACRRLTPESVPQSMSGLMLRLTDLRPTSTEVLRSGTTSGRPGEGSGSGLSWASYQAGSIHTSATQSNVRLRSPLAGRLAPGSRVASSGRARAARRPPPASAEPPAGSRRRLPRHAAGGEVVPAHLAEQRLGGVLRAAVRAGLADLASATGRFGGQVGRRRGRPGPAVAASIGIPQTSQ